MENELGGTATTIGTLIPTPRTNELLGVPATGNTAGGALVGVIVTATTFDPRFNNPAKLIWSLPAGVIVTAVDEDVVTDIAVVGPAILYTEVLDMIRQRLQGLGCLHKS